MQAFVDTVVTQVGQLLDEKFEKKLFGFATKDDLKALRIEHFATKDDLNVFATKDDLKAFATKDDLKALHIERFATKDDLKAFATKDDLKTFTVSVDGRFKDVDAKLDTIAIRVLDLDEKLDRCATKDALNAVHSNLLVSMDRFAKRYETVDQELTALYGRDDRLEKRLDFIERRIVRTKK